MSVQALREFINRHNASAAGLAALGAVLEAKVSGTPIEAPYAERIGDLLAALGASDLVADLSPHEAIPFLGELRVTLALESRLMHPRGRTVGWSFVEPEILQGAGDTSSGFVEPLARGVVPALEGLSDRLAASDAAFLDVGVGVAGLSLAVAAKWPRLRIVGIDPWQPALALARENVARAGLGDRIELREQCAEDLEDEGAFDLAWVPTNFMPARIQRAASERIHRALRPGGWILFNAINPGFDPQAAALWRLRMTMFGDCVPAADAAEELLCSVGMVDVRTLPSPPGAFICLVVGRRKPA
jgi:SAM-dependent methyltransferase